MNEQDIGARATIALQREYKRGYEAGLRDEATRLVILFRRRGMTITADEIERVIMKGEKQ